MKKYNFVYLIKLGFNEVGAIISLKKFVFFFPVCVDSVINRQEQVTTCA